MPAQPTPTACGCAATDTQSTASSCAPVMALDRLLHSILQHLKYYAQLPYRGLLWLLSHIVHLRRRMLPSCDIGCHDSGVRPSQPLITRGEAHTQGQPLETPSATSPSIYSSEPNSLQFHDPGPTTTGSSTPTLEIRESTPGPEQASGRKPFLRIKVENFSPISPREFQRYERNEIVYV